MAFLQSADKFFHKYLSSPNTLSPILAVAK